MKTIFVTCKTIAIAAGFVMLAQSVHAELRIDITNAMSSRCRLR